LLASDTDLNLKNMAPLTVIQRHTLRDTILYALGVGAGLAATRSAELLRYFYEAHLEPLATMATVMAYPGFWARDPQFGIT
jgi:hypothetical protein